LSVDYGTTADRQLAHCRRSVGRRHAHHAALHNLCTIFCRTPGKHQVLTRATGTKNPRVRTPAQADAYTGYDGLYQTGRELEIGCWAHARRGFVEAFMIDTAAALMIALIQLNKRGVVANSRVWRLELILVRQFLAAVGSPTNRPATRWRGATSVLLRLNTHFSGLLRHGPLMRMCGSNPHRTFPVAPSIAYTMSNGAPR